MENIHTNAKNKFYFVIKNEQGQPFKDLNLIGATPSEMKNGPLKSAAADSNS